MALYHIEGTSQISWSLLVGAGSESEASEKALRIVQCLCHLRESPVRDEHHRVVGSCRVIEPPVRDRPDHQWAVRMGEGQLNAPEAEGWAAAGETVEKSA